MEPRTHLAISSRLCGAPRVLAEGRAEVTLATTSEMRADERGLVHGGFVFGLADYAAMLAINDPLVVLAAAEARFVAPVAVGEELLAEAVLTPTQGKLRSVSVVVRGQGRVVFEGTFHCAIARVHVLDR